MHVRVYLITWGTKQEVSAFLGLQGTQERMDEGPGIPVVSKQRKIPIKALMGGQR